MFAKRLIDKINERCDANMATMRIIKNSDKFVHMVEQFTHWQTNVNSYRTAFEDYQDVNNEKIDLPWKPDSNWEA